MSISNRAGKIEKLYKTLKKYYTANTIAGDRSVLDLLLYACCLENVKYDEADEAFARLQQSYHDLNEVRVTTVAELREDVFDKLPNADEVATRIKKTLHSMYEERYSFDLEEMRKGNLGKAVAEIEKWEGTTAYMVAFVTQHALGGHSIPVSKSAFEFFELAEIISAAEAAKKSVPGLERTIAKAKGPEFASLLHQFIIEWKTTPKSATVQTVFKTLGVELKQPEPVAKKTATKSTKATAADKKTKTSSATKTASKATATKKATKTATKKTAAKKTPTKKDVAKKTPAKKTTAKKTATKKKATPKKSSKASSKISRKKPR